MNEEIKETEVENPIKDLTKEEILETIRNVFKDNEESLKHLDNIFDSIKEIKKLEVDNPKTASFGMWMLPILFMFGPNFRGLDKDLLKAVEDETSKAPVSDN